MDEGTHQGFLQVQCLKGSSGLRQSEPSLCNRYEEEINRRTAEENEFVMLKKVSGWPEWGGGPLTAGLICGGETLGG
jgi:hypothetical protein